MILIAMQLFFSLFINIFGSTWSWLVQSKSPISIGCSLRLMWLSHNTPVRQLISLTTMSQEIHSNRQWVYEVLTLLSHHRQSMGYWHSSHITGLWGIDTPLPPQAVYGVLTLLSHHRQSMGYWHSSPITGSLWGIDTPLPSQAVYGILTLLSHHRQSMGYWHSSPITGSPWGIDTPLPSQAIYGVQICSASHR